MKTEKQTRTVEETIYICDTCGYKSFQQWEIKNHEKSHLRADCKHLNCEYSMGCNQEDSSARIYRSCKTCGQENKVGFDSWDEEKLIAIFALLEKM